MQREEVVHVPCVHLCRQLIALGLNAWVPQPFVLKHLHTCHGSRSPLNDTLARQVNSIGLFIVVQYVQLYVTDVGFTLNQVQFAIMACHTSDVISYSQKLWYKPVYLLNEIPTVWFLFQFRPNSWATHEVLDIVLYRVWQNVNTIID